MNDNSDRQGNEGERAAELQSPVTPGTRTRQSSASSTGLQSVPSRGEQQTPSIQASVASVASLGAEGQQQQTLRQQQEQQRVLQQQVRQQLALKLVSSPLAPQNHQQLQQQQV